MQHSWGADRSPLCRWELLLPYQVPARAPAQGAASPQRGSGETSQCEKGMEEDCGLSPPSWHPAGRCGMGPLAARDDHSGWAGPPALRREGLGLDCAGCSPPDSREAPMLPPRNVLLDLPPPPACSRAPSWSERGSRAQDHSQTGSPGLGNLGSRQLLVTAHTLACTHPPWGQGPPLNSTSL